ncbi:DUF6807 family protein, partial [Bacteroidota bacterium]
MKPNKTVSGLPGILIQFFLLPVILLTIATNTARSQEYVFSLEAKQSETLPVPVYIPLENIQFDPSTQFPRLYNIENKAKIEIPCQFEPGYRSGLWFIPPRNEAKGKMLELQIEIVNKSTPGSFTAKSSRDARDITLSSNGNKILSYRYATTEAPEGADYLFRKSAYIHPLYTPTGNILTRIQPPDHYHHYGLWAPWTLVQIGTKVIDTWNLSLGEGTVRFGGLLSTTSGQVYCGFRVHQEHVDFTSSGGDQVVFNEILEVKAFPLEFEGRSIWLIDYVTSLNKAIADSVILQQYGYGGGIGFRVTEEWTKANSTVLTSESKGYLDADATHARWCEIKGEFRDGISGITFFSHPLNVSHPE